MDSDEVTGVDTPLHEAVRFCDLDEVKATLKEGHDPNQIGLYQWSAVHEAASNGDNDILKILFRYGGNPNKQDLLKGCTAMHYASQEGHINCLRLLVNAGGHCNVPNSLGNTALDVAATDECASFLKAHRDHDALTSGGGFRERSTELSDSFSSKHSLHHEDSLLDQSSLVTDDSYFDEVSIISGSTDSGKPHSQGWGTSSVVSLRKDTVLGDIQLSFEYNSKTEILKVRIWQLSEILLPPADSSMISTIYVKGYLHPDIKKETKRKTEEVKADSSHHVLLKETSVGQSQSTIFQPSSFKFSKPLEYKNITKIMVQDKTLNLDVCVTQKYSWKSFPVASFNIPLKIAVRKLVKEKFPLSARLSTNIPENMKIYSARDLQVTRSSSGFGSLPNLQSSSMLGHTSRSSYTASDSDLHLTSVDCELPKSLSTEINLTSEHILEEKESPESLQQIQIMKQKEGSTVVSVSDSKMQAYGADDQGSMTMLDCDKDSHVPTLESIEVHMPEKLRILEDWNHSAGLNIEIGKSDKATTMTTGCKQLSEEDRRRKSSPPCRYQVEHKEVSITSLVSGGSESQSWNDKAKSETLKMVPVNSEYHELQVRCVGGDLLNSNSGLAEVHHSCFLENAKTTSTDIKIPVGSSKTSIILEDESSSSKTATIEDYSNLLTLQPLPVNSGYSSTKNKKQPFTSIRLLKKTQLQTG